MKSKFSDDVFVMWQVQRKSKKGAWVNVGRAFETRRPAREKAKALRAGTHTFPQGDGRTVTIQYLSGEVARVLRVVIAKPCRPSPPMMTSPRAPGSYADTRTIHARAVQWRVK